MFVGVTSPIVLCMFNFLFRSFLFTVIIKLLSCRCHSGSVDPRFTGTKTSEPPVPTDGQDKWTRPLRTDEPLWKLSLWLLKSYQKYHSLVKLLQFDVFEAELLTVLTGQISKTISLFGSVAIAAWLVLATLPMAIWNFTWMSRNWLEVQIKS